MSFQIHPLRNFFRPGSHRRIWFAAAFLILLIAIAPPIRISSQPAERRFRIEANSFEYKPGTLRVNPGDRVTIEFVSTDVVHGIHIDGYELQAAANPGRAEQISFVADKPGSFRFHCSVTCGPLHPFMAGKLKVGPNWLFWKAMAAAVLLVFAVLKTSQHP